MQISIVLLTLFPLLLSINGYHVRKLPLVRYNCAACPSTTANTRNYERLRTALHESVVPEQKDGSLRCARPANGFLQKLKEITKAQIVQRWITGLSLGAIGTLWIVSGNGVFTLGFLLTTLIAQNEYYNMVRKTGVMPANKTGTLASLACYVTAAMVPNFHELVMPLSSIFLMMWLLIFNKKSPSISEISTSLLGMFYIGYLPSFWVRLRSIDQLAALRVNWFNLPQVLSPDMWTVGAVVTWWTWTSIVFSDVGAYFAGKNLGKHKLSEWSKAAGAASPNKTIEGAIGGLMSCSLFTLLGAYVMNWPLWPLTGIAYGIMISSIGLVGDLTASMMKRDAGVKDSGNILPGHGGLLDRIDSYMFTAPAAFLFCKHFLTFVHIYQMKYFPSVLKI